MSNSSSSSSSDVTQMLADAKKILEQKKAELQKQSKLEALKARLANAAPQLQNILQRQVPTPDGNQLSVEELNKQAKEERERSLNLIIDSEGRTIDKRTGEVVQIQSRVPTLKANIKTVAQKRDYKTALGGGDMFSSGIASSISTSSMVKSASGSSSGKLKSSDGGSAEEKFFDHRVKQKTAERNKRKLVFNEKGKYEDMANKMRAKTKMLLLQQEISSISKKTGISAESKMALIQPKRVTKEVVPAIEWWDYAVLNEINYDCLDKLTDADLREKLKINRLIEHPVQMKPPTHTDKKVVIPVMLTKKERKKMRRQNRVEQLKEEQEKIRLGLIPPPEPKVKISNLMRVLGTEAVQDPTKVEEYVRNQMAKRQKKHEEANAARKLTDVERAAKKKRKLTENTSTEVHVSIYRVRELSDPAVKFKVEANCNQLHMTGVVLLYKSLNVVVVEGGPKQQRKFKRLMLNRIKWSETHSKKRDETNGEINVKNTCALVWQGVVKNRLFSNITFKSCPTVAFAREHFKKLGCEHYWDIAQSDAILESATET